MKTGEMYNYALNNPKGAFKRALDSCSYSFYKGHLINHGGFAVSPNPNVDEDWELIPQEVTW